MRPYTWHFPVDWHEKIVGTDGRQWTYRVGLNWTLCVPHDAVVKVEVEVIDDE